MIHLSAVIITVLFWLTVLPFAILALPYFIIVLIIGLKDNGAELYFGFYRLNEWFEE